jgi:D-arabinose 5-phosphate isomerase GutQ
VVVGVGKSGHIGRKLVATFNSLGVHAAFLHPTEALHGDLGQIGPDDTLLLITFSGRTPELLALLPHLDPALPLILLTAHTRPETCELLATARRRRRQRSRTRSAGDANADADDPILLPAPVHEAESVSFGVSAPTSSTTAALAVGDALAIVAAQELHGRSVAATDGFGSGVGAVFAMNHPGGAIGAMARRENSVSSSTSSFSSTSSTSSSISPSRPGRTKTTDSAIKTSSHRHHHRTTREIRHLAIPWCDIPTVAPSGAVTTGADVLCAAYASPSGWVRLSAATDNVVPPSRIRRLRPADMDRSVGELMAWLTIGRADFVAVAADTSVRRAAEWVGGISGTAQGAGDGEGESVGFGGSGAVVGVVERGECIGVLEVEMLLAQKRG